MIPLLRGKVANRDEEVLLGHETGAVAPEITLAAFASSFSLAGSSGFGTLRGAGLRAIANVAHTPSPGGVLDRHHQHLGAVLGQGWAGRWRAPRMRVRSSVRIPERPVAPDKGLGLAVADRDDPDQRLRLHHLTMRIAEPCVVAAQHGAVGAGVGARLFDAACNWKGKGIPTFPAWITGVGMPHECA